MGKILAFNPRGRGNLKKGAKKMAKKKAIKKATRKNPRKVSAAARKAYKRAKSTFDKVSLPASLKKQPAMVGGILAAKFGANKISDSGGDRDDWDIKAYLGAGLGSFLGGLLAEQIKGGAGQKVLDAGLAYTLFKAAQNELIRKSDWATEQFGQEGGMDSRYYDSRDRSGDVLIGNNGEQYMLTEGGWRDLDERDRMMGQAVVPADPVLGQEVVTADPVLGAGGTFSRSRSSIWH